MFGHRFYGARYFAPRYFGDGGSLVVMVSFLIGSIDVFPMLGGEPSVSPSLGGTLSVYPALKGKPKHGRGR